MARGATALLADFRQDHLDTAMGEFSAAGQADRVAQMQARFDAIMAAKAGVGELKTGVIQLEGETMRAIWLGVVLAAGLATTFASAQGQSPCDRDCLSGKLDTFLKAVVADDPEAADLWAGFRQTQNTHLTAAGEGIWESNTGLGSLDRRYFDPETGQATFYGTIEEGEATAIASLRLRLHGDQVGEAEWHIARSDSPDIEGGTERTVFDLQNLLDTPPPDRGVPKDERRPRDELIAAVNSYFDGIVAQTGRHVKAHPGCLRLENGLGGAAWTGGPVGPEDAEFQNETDCRSRYGGLNIVNVSARRYLMVDEEAQMVVASAVFIREPLSPKRRNAFMELFFMDEGKIRSVYAAMVYAEPEMPVPNWPPYDGNFPISQNLVPHP